MNINKYHADVMDETRFVMPKSSNGKELICSVFFRSKSGRLDYSGTVTLPISLFAGTKMDPGMPDRVGFVLTRD